MVGAFQSSGPLLAVARRKGQSSGVLDARSLGTVFTWMRPNDLVWNYWVNNYLMGKKPPAFDILAWNDDTTNLPGALHGSSSTSSPATSSPCPAPLEVLGTPRRPVPDQDRHLRHRRALRPPHPVDGCYRATQLFGGTPTFVLSPTGTSRPRCPRPGPKAHYFTGAEPGGPTRRVARAEPRHDGHLVGPLGRLGHRPGRRREARPHELGSRRHRSSAPAPGTYVLESA